MTQFGASLTDDSRGVIYNRKIFIIQATGIMLQVCYDPTGSQNFNYFHFQGEFEF